MNSKLLVRSTVTKGGKDAEVAEIKGVIKNGMFQWTGGSIAIPTGPVNQRMITIDLGADEVKVPLQNIDHEEVQTFTVSGRAVRTDFAIYRMLRTTEDGQKVLVTPDLNNPNHFGRSS